MLKKKKQIKPVNGVDISRPKPFPNRWQDKQGGGGWGGPGNRLPVFLQIIFTRFIAQWKSLRNVFTDNVDLRLIFRCGVVVGCLLLLLTLMREPMFQLFGSMKVFKVTRIEVMGAARVDDTEIRKIMGLDYNYSMFSVSVKDIEARLLHYPWVKNVLVKKKWPNEVRVEIGEYVPAALLVDSGESGGRLMYVNEEGAVIAPVMIEDDYDYPVITGLQGLLPEERKEVMGDIAEFLKYLNRNDPNLPAQSVSEIHFNGAEGLVVRLVDHPFPIYLGQGEIFTKYKKLRKILAGIYTKRYKQMEFDKIKHIRMNYSDEKVLIKRTHSG